MSNMANQETEQENNNKIPEEKIVEWKKAHGDFRAQLPGEKVKNGN